MSLYQGCCLWQKCVSTFPIYFDVGFFSCAYCIAVIRYLLQGIAPGIAIGLVLLWEEVSLGAFYVAILQQMPAVSLIIN